MDRIIVIANPVASRFTGGAHRDVMSELSATCHVEAMWPGSAGAATKASAAAVAEGADVVVAMGGDGMVHHVAQPLVGSDASLGIIPVGTTNVVARLLDIPSRPVRAARHIAASPRPTPVGVVTMETKHAAFETTHHALFACGFGLDAEVVIEADRDPYRKYRFGSLHYARTAIGVGFKKFPRRNPHVTVSAGDRTAVVASALIQFRSVYTYFGRLAIAVSPEQPDPMTVLLVEELKRRRIPRIGLEALRRSQMGSVEGMEVWDKVKRMEIQTDPPVAAQADGESLGLVDSAEVRWNADSLRIVGFAG